MGHKCTPHLGEQQIAGTHNASAEDEYIWLEEADILGCGSTEPASDFTIYLQGNTVTPDSLLGQQLRTKVFTIEQSLLEAGLLAPA
jgi:hypothetical protein